MQNKITIPFHTVASLIQIFVSFAQQKPLKKILGASVPHLLLAHLTAYYVKIVLCISSLSLGEQNCDNHIGYYTVKRRQINMPVYEETRSLLKATEFARIFGVQSCQLKEAIVAGRLPSSHL